MTDVSRRNLLKTGLMAPAVVAAANMGPLAKAMVPADEHPGIVEGPIEAAFEDGAVKASMPGAGRERLLLDFGWRFHLGNADQSAKDFDFGSAEHGNFQKTGNFLPAAMGTFDDSEWRELNLPHDWAIELPFTNDPGLQSKGFYPLGRKYPDTSVGWYRRVFDLPAEDAGKRLTVEFDGAYRESMIVFNGFYIGTHTGGYDPFTFDVTDFANPGGRNVLLVRVDATSSDGWFYEGAGIYRHVWLVKTHPVHVKQWGTFVASKVDGTTATLSIRTELANHEKEAKTARVRSRILDANGEEVGNAVSSSLSIPAEGDMTCEQSVVVHGAKLWSLEERNRYRLVTELQVGGTVVDRQETKFGIRTTHFDPAKGLFLNGNSVKLKGTCNHQDHAGLGVALADSVQYYRVRKLQEMGCNSIRTSHNPPTSELLEACDELGMLVFDETRMMSSNPEGLSQLADLVRRDRNRPSVFMWSMGNEEGQANNDRGVLILSAMKKLTDELDGTRPVSIAPTGAIGTGGLAVLDVIGYNYMDPQAEAYHKEHPDRPVVGTETVSAVGTRGIYVTDKSKGFVQSYDPYTTTGRASAEGWWSFCNSREWLAGGFVWTGFDYRGEPSPNGWPNISSQYGIIDTCGFPKDAFFYYQSWWTEKPVLHLFPHWNWAGMEGKKIAVWVYSNLDRVELLVNGKSLGSKDVKKDSHVAWIVEYAPGVIEARGYKGDKVAMTEKRETTSAAARLVMKADREAIMADGEEVAMFAVELQDAKGRVVPITANEVTFTVSGAGMLVGTGNGDPTNQEPDKGTSRKAFGGYCMALVQATKKSGSITVEATAAGLSGAKVTITTKAIELRPQVATWEREVPEGEGVTGLWRMQPQPDLKGFMARLLGGVAVFTLRQKGSALTGTVEGGGINFLGGSDTPTPIVDGKAEGDSISFRAGTATYSGKLQAGQLELTKTVDLGSFRRLMEQPKPTTGERPAVGPPPDGTDPSFDRPEMKSSPTVAVVLNRAKR